MATSDLLVQIFYEKQKNLDRKRLRMYSISSHQIETNPPILVAAFITGAAMGIEGHVWYSFLDRAIAIPTWRNVFKKVILDQTIAAPFYTLTYIVGKDIIQ